MIYYQCNKRHDEGGNIKYWWLFLFVAQSMVREMEHLVGDELVDADHFKETLASIYARGMYETDSEESEDTEEEDENGGGGGGGQQQDGGGGDAGGGGAGGMEL